MKSNIKQLYTWVVLVMHKSMDLLLLEEMISKQTLNMLNQNAIDFGMFQQVPFLLIDCMGKNIN